MWVGCCRLWRTSLNWYTKVLEGDGRQARVCSQFLRVLSARQWGLYIFPFASSPVVILVEERCVHVTYLHTILKYPDPSTTSDSTWHLRTYLHIALSEESLDVTREWKVKEEWRTTLGWELPPREGQLKCGERRGLSRDYFFLEALILIVFICAMFSLFSFCLLSLGMEREWNISD